MGVNLYGGQRGNGNGSTRASPHLLEGPGAVSLYSYYRSHFNVALIPSITRLHRELTNIAASVAIHLDPLHISVCSKLLGVDPREICNRSILTMGLPHQNFSFVNSIHTDCNDQLPTTPDKRSILTEQELSFHDAWCTMFGYMSVPTTCCYLYVGSLPKSERLQRDDEKETARVLLYMVFPDLGIAIPIDHNMVLQFAAHVTVHHTSAAIVVTTDGKVHYRSEDFTVLGWGKSGTSSKTGKRPSRPRPPNNMKKSKSVVF